MQYWQKASKPVDRNSINDILSEDLIVFQYR